MRLYGIKICIAMVFYEFMRFCCRAEEQLNNSIWVALSPLRVVGTIVVMILTFLGMLCTCGFCCRCGNNPVKPGEESENVVLPKWMGWKCIRYLSWFFTLSGGFTQMPEIDMWCDRQHNYPL